jgi:hypothetical protein
MARRIHRGVEFFARTKKLFQDREGAIHQQSGTLSVDSFPRYDLETSICAEPKGELLGESLSIAWRILQEEQVLPLAELAHRIVEELMVNPNYTYRELLEVLKVDERFSVTSGQIISLPSVENPSEVFFQKMARKRREKKAIE